MLRERALNWSEKKKKKRDLMPKISRPSCSLEGALQEDRLLEMHKLKTTSLP